ncbi:hypothetical protein ASC80_05815 [Afipia sp. Root123D2]|uniref:hypothetical protein n=1 Tax=Afipia sp. Root123D2 TaxID=1736436 RepID=UPI0006FD679F|nr:hypothetical protein [Afipia sp. Root123D2]KQW22856.1 hypothetical protein ASC80_05815 [Afipia sp. Root123D2]
MSVLDKLDEANRRLTIGLDLLNDVISKFDDDSSEDDETLLKARAWFLVQALKREAAELSGHVQKIVGDDAQTRCEAANRQA